VKKSNAVESIEQLEFGFKNINDIKTTSKNKKDHQQAMKNRREMSKQHDT
jgi:hypothetical protein